MLDFLCLALCLATEAPLDSTSNQDLPKPLRVASVLGVYADSALRDLLEEGGFENDVVIDTVDREQLARAVRSQSDEASVYLGATVDRLVRWGNQDRLLPHVPSWGGRVPPNARDRKGRWHVLLLQPYVLASTSNVFRDGRTMPTEYRELSRASYAGEVTFPNPGPYGEGAFLILALIDREKTLIEDEESVFDWLADLDANVPPRSVDGHADYSADSDTCVRRLLDPERPEVLAVCSLDAVLRAGRPEALGWFVPEDGCLARPIGVALAASAPARAQRFLEWIGSDEVLSTLAQTLKAIPTLPEIALENMPWPPGSVSMFSHDFVGMARQAPAVQARFQGDIQGQVRRRYELFDAAAEWVALIVLVLGFGVAAFKVGRV